MEKFLSSNALNIGIGIVLVILGLIQIFNSIHYIKGILHRGTKNGFALFVFWYAPFIGLVLLVIGICVLIGIVPE
ncbi:hypothetical protein [Lactobacillus acetotolerans]|uniref:hypothetical protein n=1 Tax=Lactobacillus acetotolerans TaxID=1600 RepID=UPI0019D1F4E9|nr:hypothetical protein [Lactobacillus acetotolerans]MBN7276330.1 hypothetical protein [Lactobacillus acetotolerans]